MNPIDFEFKAAAALNAWRRHYDQRCLLVLDGDSVKAVSLKETGRLQSYNLWISLFEVEHGLTPARWMKIGCALYRIWKDEPKCPHPQKLLLWSSSISS